MISGTVTGHLTRFSGGFVLRELADGRIAPEQAKTAVEMADRTKAAEATLQGEHENITSLRIDLRRAATNDPAVADFATRVATHSLDEIEVLCLRQLLSDYLRLKYPPEPVKANQTEHGTAQPVQSGKAQK